MYTLYLYLHSLLIYSTLAYACTWSGLIYESASCFILWFLFLQMPKEFTKFKPTSVSNYMTFSSCFYHKPDLVVHPHVHLLHLLSVSISQCLSVDLFIHSVSVLCWVASFKIKLYFFGKISELDEQTISELWTLSGGVPGELERICGSI